MAVKNLTEDAVRKEYERLRSDIDDFCGCDVCRDDVMVYALNRLRTHYVTERRGAVLQRIEMEKEQSGADIAVALLAGFKLVKAKPRPRHREIAAGEPE